MNQRDARHRSGQGPPDVNVMQAQISMLFETLGEVKALLKSLDDAVGLIRVFDLQIKKHDTDISRLETDVREYKRDLESVETRLLAEIAAVRKQASDDVEEVRELAEDTKSTISNNLSYVKGALAAVTVLGAVLYAVAIWWGSRYISMADEHDRFVQTLQTLRAEDHLRDSMSRPKTEIEYHPKNTDQPRKEVERSGVEDDKDLPVR